MYATLKASIWVGALLRRAQTAGAFATLIYKGDVDAGTVLVKTLQSDTICRLYHPVRDMQGERIWHVYGPYEESQIDDYIQNRRHTDPDIWVVEITDKSGQHFITERVVISDTE